MIVHESIFPATLSALADARKQVRRALDDLRFSEELKSDVEIALAEAGSNPVRHANPSPTQLRIRVMANSRGVETLVADNGETFAGFDARLLAMQGMPDPLSESGRGIALIKNASDHIIYENVADWNCLTMLRRHVRSRLTILVAEDSQATLSMFVAMLSQKYNLITASSVEELKSKLPLDIDLLLTDLHLGDGKSSDYLATLETTREGLQIPVILVTSDTSGLAVRDAVKLGAETVLEKPVRARTLLDAIDKSLAARTRQRMNEARHFNAILEEIVGKPDLSRIKGFNAAWKMGTAGFGGGDLLIDLGGTQRRRIALADLMGHGVNARARAATWAGMLRGAHIGLEDAAPHEFVNRFSTALCRAGMPDHVIGTLLVIDLLDDGNIELASAGHPAPLLLSNGQFTEVPLGGALPGLVEIACEATVRIQLKQGERLIAATDGIDPQGLAYKLALPEKVMAAALEPEGRSVADVAEAMACATDMLTGYRPSDDWTLLLIERAAAPFRP
jgi:anti-sigma regulatory factor (Ser/Thr protein kinase)/CheY-like chemotaxis protein